MENDLNAQHANAILDSLPHAMIEFDPDGVARFANRAARVQLGLPEALTLQSFLDLPGWDSESRLFLKGLLAEADSNVRRVNWAEGDSRRVYSVIAAPVHAPGGVVGTMLVLYDYTGQVQAEHVRSDLISAASHELRSPTMSVLNFAEALLDGMYGPLQENQQDVLRRILANAHRLSDVIAELITSALIEKGNLPEATTVFPADVLTTFVEEFFGRRAEEKGILLEMESQLPVISGNQAHLKTILSNLAANSLKYTDSGRIMIRLLPEGGKRWLLEVEDTGIGIPEDAIASIFDRFYQVDRPDKKRGGVGLGLWIVKELADRMDGQIHVSSTPGAGTKFTLSFPLQKQE